MKMEFKGKLLSEHPVVCYDGYCGLCDRFVRKLINIDNKKRFRYIALQNPMVQQLFEQNGIDKNSMPDSVVLIVEGEIFFKSEAIFQTLKILGYPYKVLAVFSFFPGILTDFIYDVIARSRYRIFGKKESCEILQGLNKDVFIP